MSVKPDNYPAKLWLGLLALAVANAVVIGLMVEDCSNEKPEQTTEIHQSASTDSTDMTRTRADSLYESNMEQLNDAADVPAIIAPTPN